MKYMQVNKGFTGILALMKAAARQIPSGHQMTSPEEEHAVYKQEETREVFLYGQECNNEGLPDGDRL